MLSYINDEIIVDDNVVDIYENEWIQDSSEVLDSLKYNVYQGIGDNSLVKLLIQEELSVDI